jgi:SOS response regulatory protein OraA/RecX
VTASGWDRLLRILSHRPHSRQELRRKMRRRGYTDQEVEGWIEKAERLHLLEPEEELATRFALELRRRRSANPRWTKHKLLERGFDSDVSERAVAGAFEDWDGRSAAVEVLDSEPDLDKAARRLSRRGFPADDLQWAVQNVRRSRRREHS